MCRGRCNSNLTPTSPAVLGELDWVLVFDVNPLHGFILDVLDSQMKLCFGLLFDVLDSL
jgi:hypothetical protein